MQGGRQLVLVCRGGGMPRCARQQYLSSKNRRRDCRNREKPSPGGRHPSDGSVPLQSPTVHPLSHGVAVTAPPTQGSLRLVGNLSSRGRRFPWYFGTQNPGASGGLPRGWDSAIFYVFPSFTGYVPHPAGRSGRRYRPPGRYGGSWGRNPSALPGYPPPSHDSSGRHP